MKRWHHQTTIAGIDPDTPVCDLNEESDYGRNSLITVSDEERYTLAWLVQKAEVRKDLLVVQNEHQQWFESAWGRVGVLAALIVAIADVLSLVLHH